jgi:hypothetical protein
MNNLTDEQKNEVVKNILLTVDNVNLIIQTPNYSIKYSEEDDTMVLYENDEQYKRYLVSSRERLRKILLTDWYQSKFTTSQISDISNTLSLVREKISDIFTN